MSTTDQLTSQLDRLAAADTGPFPVVSLFLDLRPNEHGRDQFEPFLRKELADEYPRYLALLVDTHSARIFVFAMNELLKTEQIEGRKTKHHKKGGWSQARYQRHTENFHVQHAKEVVDVVERIAAEEAIDK